MRARCAPLCPIQVQFSLLDRRPLNGMLQLCQSRGIKLFTYGSVAGGLLSDKFLAQPTKNLLGQPKWPPIDLNTSSLKMYHNVAQMFGGMVRACACVCVCGMHCVRVHAGAW